MVAVLALFGVFAVVTARGGGFFDVDGTLEDNGWRLERKEPNDAFSVSGGVLSMRCSCCPCKGTLYSREVDVPERGSLQFDLSVGEGTGPMRSFAVLFKFGDLLLSVRDGSLMRHRANPEPQWKCVGEHRVPRTSWTTVKVSWDNAAGCVSYYVGDMRIPSASEPGRISPGPGDEGVRVRIGNYGIDGTVLTHRIRRLSIADAGERVSDGEPDRRLAIVFHGLTSEFFPLEKWLDGFSADDRVDFYLSFRGSQYLPKNNMGLDGYPDEGLLRRAKLLVLADMPLSEEVLSYAVQTNILAAVSAGARLIATGGLVGLEKCGDLDSPVARALPGLSGSPWRPPSEMKSVRRHGKGQIAVVRRAAAGATPSSQTLRGDEVRR